MLIIIAALVGEMTMGFSLLCSMLLVCWDNIWPISLHVVAAAMLGESPLHWLQLHRERCHMSVATTDYVISIQR